MSETERTDIPQPPTSPPERTGTTPSPPAENPPTPGMREMVVKSFGGWWGLLDSALPVVAFVIANLIGGLTPALWTGMAVGALILVLRLVRKESPQQAISGFLGVAVCVVIARYTGEARDFFILGIWRSALMGGLAVLSVLVRWPLIGVVWEIFDPSAKSAEPASDTKAARAPWRRSKPLMRVYTWTTLMWAAAYAFRFFLERFLYNDNETGILGTVRLAVGYPMLAALVAVSYLAVRHTRQRLLASSTGST